MTWNDLLLDVAGGLIGSTIVGLVAFGFFVLVRMKFPQHQRKSGPDVVIDAYSETRNRANKDLDALIRAIAEYGTSELFPLLVEALFRFAIASTIGAVAVILVLLSVFIQEDVAVMPVIKFTSVVLVAFTSLFFFLAVLEMWKAKSLLETTKLERQRKVADGRNGDAS